MSRFDYQAADDMFSQLLRIVGGSFSPSEAQEVLHFVEVGEYGLALDTFVGIVVEKGKPIPSAACDLFEHLAAMIDFEQYLAWLGDVEVDAAVALLREHCHAQG
jgi:hypothetical protein